MIAPQGFPSDAASAARRQRLRNAHLAVADLLLEAEAPPKPPQVSRWRAWLGAGWLVVVVAAWFLRMLGAW